MKKTIIVILLLILIGVSGALFNTNNTESNAETSDGFKHAPIQFENFTIELTGSEYKGNQYTFRFEIINTGDAPLNVNKTSFEIKNGNGQLFASEPLKTKFTELNPNMSTNGEVSFVMNREDLEQETPIMQIEHGYIFDESFEFQLVK